MKPAATLALLFLLSCSTGVLSYGCKAGATDGGSQGGRPLIRTDSPPKRAGGPLRIHSLNPRYFTDGSGKAVYVTGSHTHHNLLDRLDRSEFDYAAYLHFLTKHNHNFIRLWVHEHARVPLPEGQYIEYDPLPYERTGPGTALDGQPKFDLTRFNQEYFDRLRSRVKVAQENGIYVAVMLFQGWGHFGFDEQLAEDSTRGAWDGHPFNIHNNINGVDGNVDGDGRGGETHTLSNSAVTAIQEAYVRKVIDTLNDLDNVLWEISNESHAESQEWQYHMINYIREYESTKPKQHPIGMTAAWFGGDNAQLFASPADWISPLHTAAEPYKDNPPAADGSKVILPDTDHLWGNGGNQAWVWKSFTRGLNPIFMDVTSPLDMWTLATADAVRWAMGHTRAYADKMNLAIMTPREDLVSTGYCLANPGEEYLVYIPHGSHWAGELVHTYPWLPFRGFWRRALKGTVTVDLSAASGSLQVEWFNPTLGETFAGGTVAGGDSKTFTAPFRYDAVLYLVAGEAPLPDEA